MAEETIPTPEETAHLVTQFRSDVEKMTDLGGLTKLQKELQAQLDKLASTSPAPKIKWEQDLLDHNLQIVNQQMTVLSLPDTENGCVREILRLKQLLKRAHKMEISDKVIEDIRRDTERLVLLEYRVKQLRTKKVADPPTPAAVIAPVVAAIAELEPKPLPAPKPKIVHVKERFLEIEYFKPTFWSVVSVPNMIFAAVISTVMNLLLVDLLFGAQMFAIHNLIYASLGGILSTLGWVAAEYLKQMAVYEAL